MNSVRIKEVHGAMNTHKGPTRQAGGGSRKGRSSGGGDISYETE